MFMSLHEDKRVPFGISERWRAEDALRLNAERQAMLLEVTSDLIRTSEPGELSRKTFEHVGSAFGAVVCTNYRLDPAAKRLRLVFVHGIPPEYLEAAQSLELGQEYCGTAAASCQPLVADKLRIASDPNGGLVRKLGATAYACYPLKASDGRLLGTFAVASATRESFTDDEVAWLGTITNFLAQAWERFEAEQSLRVSEERLRLSQVAGGLGYWDYDYASGTLVWSEQTRKLLGVEPGEPASRALLRSRVHPEDRPRLDEEHIARSARLDSDHIRHFEFRVVMPNGAVRWLEDQDLVATNAAGMPVRAVGVLRDITARKRAEEAQARLAAIVTLSADAIVGKTLDGIVTSWNEAAERMFGYAADEMIGQSIRRLIPTDRQAEEDMILGCVARGERVEHCETVRNRKDGRTIEVSITVSPMRDSEGRVIGASKIVRDITARKQAEKLLRRQADLLDQSHDAILTWKIGGGITYWSRGAQALYGYTPEEAIGRSSHDLLRTLSPIPTEEVEAQIAREGSWYGELTHTTREGRTIVVESRHVRVSYDGEIYALETNRDITARKAHEEHVQLLMREVNHRAKNMLSLVQAIARQTTAREPEDFVGRFTERIQALSANQDLLVRSEWQGVDVDELVRAQLAHFADLVGSRIAVHGPKLRLNAAAAQAIGLTLHELATNAGKYGALSTDKGHVDVRWGTDGGTLTMSWTERNGPPVSPPERRGFGSTVIASMARATVGGEVQLDYAPSGLVWRLTCPAANGLETGEREQIFREGKNRTDGATSRVNAQTAA
jgi:PAS domain S-box-containing protein